MRICETSREVVKERRIKEGNRERRKMKKWRKEEEKFKGGKKTENSEEKKDIKTNGVKMDRNC